MVYRLLFRTILARMDAERAHHLGLALIRLAGAVPLLQRILRKVLAPCDPVLKVHALGLDFPGPLGLAAGFDKNALIPGPLAALGFGFVEVGTLTALPQPGNPQPRLFRLTGDRALINRMGFNNDGASAAAQRLSRLHDRRVVVGVNIGRSKAAADADAVSDYVSSTTSLAGAADYLVVNVSSPNTPGLRALQAVDQLRPLLAAVRATLDQRHRERRVPLLVKIAPDLADEDIDAIADLALELQLDGIIATNTTISRAGLRTPGNEVADLGPGGLSGPVLRGRSLEVLRRLRKRTGDELVLIAAGGISNGQDAWERIEAGATLVQAYTAFIYGGPFWPASVHRDLARRTRAAGLASIQQAVGIRAG